jgi:hypothetical protein
MTTTDVSASELARELNLSPAALLQRADDLIDRVVRTEGLDAARGLSVRHRTRGQVTETWLTARLADLVRQE